MNCRNFLSLIILVAGSITAVAQSNLLNAKSPDEIGKKSVDQLLAENDTPLPYGFVADRDILMGKAVWEIIDLDERINFPLYFPVDTANIGNERRSLFHVLIKAIKDGSLTEVYADSYFNTKRTLKELENTFKFRDTVDAGRDEINTFYDDYMSGAKVLDPQFIDERFLTSQDVTGYRIKGLWYFDKRQGELKYRMIGICPVATEARDIGNDDAVPIELFWIYFPAARDILNMSYAFNDKNSAMPISFDRLLNSRRFNAVIYQEENVYGDREIEKYMKDNAQMQLLEAERVKDKIRDFEQDMWNY
jgi:gliding motility associated protien GldN